MRSAHRKESCANIATSDNMYSCLSSTLLLVSALACLHSGCCVNRCWQLYAEGCRHVCTMFVCICKRLTLQLATHFALLKLRSFNGFLWTGTLNKSLESKWVQVCQKCWLVCATATLHVRQQRSRSTRWCVGETHNRTDGTTQRC
jgi:hypothetical protein